MGTLEDSDISPSVRRDTTDHTGASEDSDVSPSIRRDLNSSHADLFDF